VSPLTILIVASSAAISCGSSASSELSLTRKPLFMGDIKPCHHVECLNGGVCHASHGEAACECTSAWTGPRCETAVAPASGELTFARQEHLTALDAVLQDITVVGGGPTGSSRKMYLFSMSMAAAWSYIRPMMPSQPPTVYAGRKPFPSGGSISGVHDGWNFDAHASMDLSPSDAAIWITHAIAEIMTTRFLSGYDVASVMARERQARGWSVDMQDAEVARVREGNWEEFTSLFDAWWTARAADGSSDPDRGAYQATVADIPSMAMPLDVDSPADPGDSKVWHPLTSSSGAFKTQSFLGYKWGTITSTFMSEQDDQDALDYVATFLPADDAEREAEIEDVLAMSETLTDHDKLSSEVWAGGPTTVIPPGQFGWFWRDYVRRFLPASHLSSTGEMDAHFLSALDIGVRLFEGGRITWAAKAKFMQSRPIQEIRNRFRDRTVNGVFGSEISTNLWMPYQTRDFVTPPFADYPSGHSHFSQGFIHAMTKWFGPNIDAEELPLPYLTVPTLRQLSPVFNVPITEPLLYMTFPFKAGCSEIDPGNVPVEDFIYGGFSTWAEVATAVGFSRLTGGIHALSAHTGSQALADFMSEKIEEAWGIQTDNL